MERLHGSEWKKALTRQEASQSGAALAGPMGPGDGGGVAVPAPAGTLVPGSTAQEQGSGAGLREETLARLGQSFSIRRTQGGPLSDPGNAQSPMEYRLAAPAPVRRAWSLSGSDFGGGGERGALVPAPMPAGMVLNNGTGAPSGAPSRPGAMHGCGPIPLVVSRMAHDIFVAGEPTASETTEECTERLQQLGGELFAHGCEPDEVHYSQLSVNYMRDLREIHRGESSVAPVSEEPEALKVLAASSFEDVEDLQDLEARVRALGMMAGLSYDQIASYVTCIWFTRTGRE